MKNYKPHRSVLYIPALNMRAMSKIPSLDCDTVIIDLEDSVAPSEKTAARENLKTFFDSASSHNKEIIVRINSLYGEWGHDDLEAAQEINPSAILLPKVERASDVLSARDLLKTREDIALWAMIETPRAILNIAEIAQLGHEPDIGLSCFVAGTNDLIKETGVRQTSDRKWLIPWLMQIVLGARAGNIEALDGVSNNFSDIKAFQIECEQGRDMGFDGKTLIHPSQIQPANAVFSPDPAQIEEALSIRAVFNLPENKAKGVLSLNGKMIERLHLEQAERLLAKAGL